MTVLKSCPLCGADPEATGKFAFDSWSCGTWRNPDTGAIINTVKCCRRQNDSLRAVLRGIAGGVGAYGKKLSRSDMMAVAKEAVGDE